MIQREPDVLWVFGACLMGGRDELARQPDQSNYDHEHRPS
jgi:hypothetical protein